MSSPPPPAIFKIITVGNMGVGKTCLIHRYARGYYPGDETTSTLCPEYMIKHTTMMGVNIMFKILDTAGQERFQSITRPFYRNTHCVIYAYDVTDTETLDELHAWKLEVEDFCDPVLKVLVGTKVDKENQRQVTRQQGEAVARQFGCHSFLEVSSKTGDCVDNLFFDIGEFLVQKYQKGLIEGLTQDSQSITPSLSNSGTGGDQMNHKKGCKC